MDVRRLGIDGLWEFSPEKWRDDRGFFLEYYKSGVVADAIGHPFSPAQANHSVSRKGTLRGIHFADVPPSQAKYVYCSTGAVLDVIVDIRVGSPTFGRHETVVLDDSDCRGLYVAEGLGHAFVALTEGASVTYLVSEPFSPGREHGINPLDEALGIRWPDTLDLVLSPKDRAAPLLADAQAAGILPIYEDCLALYARLRQGQ